MLLWAILKPSSLLIAIVVLGTALLWRGEPSRRWGRRLITLSLALILALLALPLERLYLDPLQRRFPPPVKMPAEVDGIIALRGATLQNRSARKKTILQRVESWL